MFKAAELGEELSKEAFAAEADRLRKRLLDVQFRLDELRSSVILIVSGVETAGKNRVVNRLHAWLDTRGLDTAAFWDESDEERERPRHWRFWRRLPARGRIGIFFGSWYTQPLMQCAAGKLDAAAFEAELARIAALERTLAQDGSIIVKLWFHVDEARMRSQLKEVTRAHGRSYTPHEKQYRKNFNALIEAADAAIRATDAPHARWHIIDARHRRYRELTAGRLLLAALEQRLVAASDDAAPPEVAETPKTPRTVLDQVDLSARVDDDAYRQQLSELQNRLAGLTWAARDARQTAVFVFEGWDAAGKGGAIRRVIAGMDARLFQVIRVAAPTDEELSHHYLWRFWRHLPRAGYFTFYDRSWYGRVLVERVEGFAKPHEWQRAYNEINDFEAHLAGHGLCVHKFWLHVSDAEQLRRFREREQVAHKQHKLTEEDWRNRDKRAAYEAAVNDMVLRTDSPTAPWTLVAADCKRHARLTVLRTICDRLESHLADR